MRRVDKVLLQGIKHRASSNSSWEDGDGAGYSHFAQPFTTSLPLVRDYRKTAGTEPITGEGEKGRMRRTLQNRNGEGTRIFARRIL